MTTALYIHEGSVIDHTPAGDVFAGDVIVLNDLVGVAKLDIPAGTLGTLAVAGIFDFPKATGGGTAIDGGLSVYWDAAAQEATIDAGSGAVNALLGMTIADAADSASTVRVRLAH